MKYLFQAGRGQMSFITHARPIAEVCSGAYENERIPSRTRKLLSEIKSIKAYGESFGLKPTSNYEQYVHLDRDAAVWVVSACRPLKFQSKTWKFPIVGSFPFLGWFDRDQAEDFAKELKKEGWDVDVRGASAYSTLGWFSDPVLSTMITSGPEALGNLINVVIHESVHATHYIKGQSFFNESFANFVADQMTLSYLDQVWGVDSPEKLAYVSVQKLSESRQLKLHEAYQILSRLYESQSTDEQKMQKKELVLAQLRQELGWKRSLNNATLLQFKTYFTGETWFEESFQRCDRKWNCFLTEMKKVSVKDFSQPDDRNFGPFKVDKCRESS